MEGLPATHERSFLFYTDIVLFDETWRQRSLTLPVALENATSAIHNSFRNTIVAVRWLGTSVIFLRR